MGFSVERAVSVFVGTVVVVGLSAGCTPVERKRAAPIRAEDLDREDATEQSLPPQDPPSVCGPRVPVVRLESVGRRIDESGAPIWLFDVWLQNAEPEARWIILPNFVPRDGHDRPAPGRGKIDSLRVEHFNTRGRITVVRAFGRGGFQALLLPPKVRLVVRDLPIRPVFLEAHDAVTLDAVFARDVLLQGKALSELIPGKLASEDKADVTVDSDPQEEVKSLKLALLPDDIQINAICKSTTKTGLSKKMR